jgi:hypothetical protein
MLNAQRQAMDAKQEHRCAPDLLSWRVVLQNLGASVPQCSDASFIKAAADDAERCQNEAIVFNKFDDRPRWIAVSMAHPVEFDLFQSDARTKFYFADNGSGSTTPSVMSSEGYHWWIQTEPMFMREARLRQIFGAYVCGEALPHMEPWNVEAYANVETDPVREMTTAITKCLDEVASEIVAVPTELREPEYLRLEREQDDCRSRTKKRSSD